MGQILTQSHVSVSFPQRSVTTGQPLVYNCVSRPLTEGETQRTEQVNTTSLSGITPPHEIIRKKELEMFYLGKKVSYNHVLLISFESGNNVVQQYHVMEAVCPLQLKT